ncbi:hypothetical protein M408DRAFT_329848 [Serendipita vermifera MAFF 305830]|uniref:Uncharacterized protein n=1 Tax=Serendipita vermifera MAFF 305830 TaxID=933852 RepID=A0A0C3AKF8_SERVB|nr:hypothetical protein M408DRAFT_331503 [Serendipita vermifera MAFF 305830]KIM27941.1 hypothetical protein M408DRAFT_329848 [Serendipita vermifera MAFF 305830]
MDIDEDPWSDDEAVTCIPFSPQKGDSTINAALLSYPSSNVSCDLPHGPQERYKIYSETWNTLHASLKETAKRMYAPVLAKVFEVIHSSEEVTDPRKQWIQKLMPTREIPAALVVGDDKQEIFDEIASEVTDSDDAVLSILVPSYFTSLQVVLKAMIEDFVRNHDEKKRRTTSAVAAHDMQLLCSWYTQISRGQEGPKLVVLIQDIEMCSTPVVHDLLHICSNYKTQLPFIFVFGAASSDVMTTMFSRATRTLLSVKRFVMPDEHQMFDFVMQELFFNPVRFPNLFLSGSTLSWLYHSWSSYHNSFNALVSHLQLIYIRHFQNPLTILWRDPQTGLDYLTNPKHLAKDPAAQKFRQLLDRALEPQEGSNEAIIERVSTAASLFRKSIQQALYALQIFREVQAYLRELSPQQHALELSVPFVRVAGQFGDGKLGDISSKLLKRVRLLTGAQLQGLLERIVQVSTRDTETATIADAYSKAIEKIRLALTITGQTDEDAHLKHQLSQDLAVILEQLWQTMSSWKTPPLSQVWRTSDTELPVDILNPSVRSSVLTSLTHPGEYLLHDLRPRKASTKSPKKKREQEDTTNRTADPDICILFSRYINAGRTINVYDWFESFVQGIEATKPRKQEKRSGKDKGKGKPVGNNEEVWRREVYARFMWAVHEMDMLGMLRWSGRGTGKKGAECAGKVVWITPDDS